MSAEARETAAAALRLPRLGRIASVGPTVVHSLAPLRVCHVMSADLWAGAEVQVATMAAYLVKDPGIDVSAVLMNEGPLACALRRMGVRVEVVDETRTGALGILRFLTRFFKENGIQLVHTHRCKDSVLGTLAAKLAGVPNIVRTVHGLREPMTGWNRLKFRVYESLDKVTLVCLADLILAVSKQIAETLRESGYRPTMVSHIHNGVDLGTVSATRSRDETRALLGIDSGAVLFGTAGRLSPVKGHAGLLRAARMVLETIPTARLVIAGGGPLAGELRAYAGCLGIDGKCLFLGPRSDVHDLIAAMDVFVLPSLHEGIPMAVLEAMVLGTPVVATDVGGTPEVIQNGVNGLLVPLGDDRALADACVDLVVDPARARLLAANARGTVEEGFSHERSGRDLVDAYRSISRVPGDGAAPIRPRFVPGPDARPPLTVRRLTRAVLRKALDSGTQAVERARGRREMNRIRRNPEPLRMALRSAARVLIVCHGNIIRSPFAARLVARLLDGRRPVTVLSAGLEAMPGNPPHPTALRLACTHQIDLSRHAASRVGPADVAASDVIFVMDLPQLVALRQRFPAARQKTFLLACLAPGVPLEIIDPIGGDDLAFKRCFDNISRAAEPVSRTLFGRTGLAHIVRPDEPVMKASIKQLLGRALFASRVDRLLFRNTAVIVAFHRVLEAASPSDPLSIDTRTFERFCRYFALHFDVVSLPELARSLQAGGSVSRQLAITFDDGYRDNFEHAAPILSRLSLPATFFVVTQWIGTDVVPWWDDAAGVRHPWMTWDEVRALSRLGFDIGAHTRTHVDLGQVTGKEARDEILGARLELQAQIGGAVESFAYPYGGPAHFTERNRAVVKASGFSCCCSGFGGVNASDTDPFHLRRMPISTWYASPDQFGFETAVGLTESALFRSRDHTCCETLEATGS